jgi:GT2 family glycosyltransferase
MPLSWSAVIATLDRAGPLERSLRDLIAQTRPPARIVVVDASADDRTAEVCRQLHSSSVPIVWQRAQARSAARQRNQGAVGADSDLIAFVDDDVELPPDVFAQLIAAFERDASGRLGGIAARIAGLTHPVPHGLSRLYFRLQAGYAHPNYGGRIFGPAVNCLPSYTPEDPQEIEAQWLNSTCTLYRRDVFERERFPEFDGYSFMEDAHLALRVGRTHRLAFHRDALYRHVSAPTAFKRDLPALLRMQLQNRRRIARELLGLRGVRLAWHFFLLRCFDSAVLVRSRPPGWGAAIATLWTT